MNRAVTPEEQRETRINVRVKGPMAAHLESVNEARETNRRGKCRRGKRPINQSVLHLKFESSGVARVCDSYRSRTDS